MLKQLPAIIACALACLIFSACGGTQSSPSGTIKAFASFLEKGDAKSAVELIDPAVVAQPEMKQKLQSLVAMGSGEIKNKGGIKSIEIVNEKVNGDTATVSVKYTYGNGTTDSESQDLVKVDGKWYLKMGN
ncbi:MAG TPA: DUF4878 domain-containing protein [Opitutales bacterium]|nr:DUF4878 domain-containing protein [Opitutales bacterium]